jgi:cobalt-zinc-cadmium efflux system protein
MDEHGHHGHEGIFSEGNLHGFERNRRALLIAIGITGVIMFVEFIGGYLANSLALMSDAGHMLTDMMSLFLSVVALRLATRTPSSTRTYGLYRMEILAALINGTTLILLSAYIGYEAYERITSPQVVDSKTMLLVATIGLVANGIAAWTMRRSSKDNLNIRGAYLHILGDALSSVGVIVGGFIIFFLEWYLVDPIISMAICLVILRGAFTLVKDSANVLLDAVPKEIDLNAVQRSLKTIAGVKDLHHVHLRAISSGVFALSAHVLIDDMLMSGTGQIIQDINRLLADKYRISHTTIQLECENCQEGFMCSIDKVCVAVSQARGHVHNH